MGVTIGIVLDSLNNSSRLRIEENTLIEARFVSGRRTEFASIVQAD